MRVGAAGRTTFFYLIFGLIWIVTSGALVNRLFDDPESIVGFELIKGSFFVLVSAALIYFTIARHAELVLRSEIESIERFKQSEERFRTLVEGISDHLIILLNARGEIRTWNPGAENLTGFSERDMKGKHYRVLFPGDAQEAGLPDRILDDARSGPVSTSGKRMRADGTSFTTAGTIAPVHDSDGSVAGFTKITRDLTEALDYRTALEKRVVQYSIIADVGRKAISDQLSDLSNTVAVEVARGLGADHVVMLHAESDDSAAKITASWTDDDSQDRDTMKLPIEEIRAITEACQNLDAGATSLEGYRELNALGFRSAAAVSFGSPDLGSRCLGVLFRETTEIDDDDRHFLSAMARIIQTSLTREQAQQAIIESEMKFSLIISQVPAIVWTVDAEMIIRTSTGSGLRLLGFPANRSTGKSAVEVLPEHAADVVREAVEGKPGTYRIEIDGRHLETSVEPMRLLDGTIIGAVGLSIDITAEKERQEALERSRQELESERNRLRLILAQVPAILLVVDHDLIIQTVMGAGLQAFGRSNNETAGLSLTDFVPPDHPLLAAATRVLAGDSMDVTMTYRERIFNLHMEPLRSADGSTITGAITLGRDVTDEVAAQQELLEKSHSLERLSAQLIDAQENERERIARELHDEFGGMFTSLSFDVSWIRESASSPDIKDRASDMAARIDHAMKRVREVARELRPKVLDDFGLVPAIEDLVTSFSDRYGIETNISSRPEEISLGKGHDIMLYRIIQEALTNIARHSGATRAEVRLRTADDQLIAEIRDDGRGIRPEDISGSSSLGIVGMRERTEILGGDLDIEPFEGKGTIVRVTVPRRRDS